MQRFQTHPLPMGQTLELVRSRMSMSKGILGGRNAVDKGRRQKSAGQVQGIQFNQLSPVPTGPHPVLRAQA